MNTRTRPLAALGTGLTAALLLAACGQSEDAATPAASSTPEPTATSQESANLKPRLVLTYDSGIQVLDATTLELVADLELDGFNRVNPAGDGRHVMVSTAGGFQVLDAGTWAQAHGDHSHFFVADPTLTDLTYQAQTPGHVVVHDGRTALFDDGTGQVTIVDSADIAAPDAERRELSTPQAHHGVAVELSDGSVVVSEGDEDARTGIRLLDADGTETAVNDQCPGVHGEAMAAGETVVIGCENGALVVKDGQITKVTAPDAYGRIGNQAGSEDSPIVLGDYKSDPDAELERPTRVSLIDTRSNELTLVDLPSSYTFRSLARGDDGEALVLGTDGHLHVIDPESGTLLRSMPVLDAWEEPENWQEPRPAIQVHDGTAYITDPANDRLLAVDILTGEVWNTADLTVTPNELTVATGEAAAHADQLVGGEDHADHDHAKDEDAGDDHAHEEATATA
ncbi:zinc metallochaperone AztD [Cellulomonas sp. NPDC089187]|uniref:zinc metallochaperone AztD n=1 Tax=Cellulomonas sp. NPDC089187 TaxID=3154970 RepID=UPI00341F3EAA